MPYAKFDYMYCDANNYKVHASVWLDEGLDSEISEFKDLLEREEYFIAEQVGLPALQLERCHPDDLSVADQVWHSFVDLCPYAELPLGVSTVSTARELFERFKLHTGRWEIQHAEIYKLLI